ncbi:MULTISPECIES: phage tail protein [Clostridium]|uniref:Prophage minor tail protein Z (GPZ) n=1 Tax=Clostridium carnis TaxID=1530 RepID=A0ABY6SRR9_9CLOT|nr:phage tail protein [Clostridium carnis]CAI3560322.1 Prophage minor tail protein Z (GPZ) [Clostridium neonatale]CAI3561718.1 Prophage minor tail protein Z (GPZ) [Clostridium neonatale]CAI3582599.1 Prophage minor tail protein Z (GPZ) [Clostridium neonatale]CAI3622375.1 Prophage minor tail protein Z (GPZ) [Clostridium neonatale]CAI3675684.1 Prophage minor tail protein Z (GPZ) [Clostridium neonatale]
MATLLKIDDKEIKEALKKLNKIPKQIPRASASAINRTITFANKRLKQEIRKEYTIKNTEIQSTITLRKANPSNLSAVIESCDRRLTLQRFGKSLASWKKGRPIRVRVKKTGAKKLRTNPKAFVIGLNGNLHIAKRTGKKNKNKKKETIEVLRTLSVPQMVSNRKIEQIIKKEAEVKLKERIEHEINYRLSKLR